MTHSHLLPAGNSTPEHRGTDIPGGTHRTGAAGMGKLPRRLAALQGVRNRVLPIALDLERFCLWSGLRFLRNLFLRHVV